MSCDRPRRRAGAGLVLALLALGCGKQGDPRPPVRWIPAPTQDLAVRQRGWAFVLELSYPNTTASGAALPGVEAVEIWRLARPAPAAGTEPRRLDPREFAAAAERLLTLEGAELSSAVSGDRIVARLLIPEPLPSSPEAHTFAVRTRARGGETSDLSNQATLVPTPPPDPPQEIRVIARAEGIEVAWSLPAEAAGGFNVYRRLAQEKSYGEAIHGAGPEERRFLDRGARYGERYIYTVTTVASREPLIEGGLSGEGEIAYEDRFPPPPPREVIALAEVERVRLRWEASAAPDVAGYRIYRRDPGQDFRLVTPRPVTETEHLDTGLASGLTYVYRVTAVDALGNEGPAGDEVSVQVQ